MYFDIAMPLTLFLVTLASMFLNGKAEDKLKSAFKERKFTVWDAVLLVGAMAAMIFLIVVASQMGMALMIIFLFSYSMLLFLFTYLFSNNRWYIAIAPPALFVFLYAYFRDTPMWYNYLINVYGVVFAILITLYLGSFFTWKSTVIFTGLLTVVDVVLVLVTGTMVSAANQARSLNLPVLISLPVIPEIVTELGKSYMSLGLGDFFFAGLLAIQTFKNFGRRFAVLSVVAMVASFFAFEAFILTYGLRAFPGTLMIICGWLPLVIGKMLKNIVE